LPVYPRAKRRAQDDIKLFLSCTDDIIELYYLGYYAVMKRVISLLLSVCLCYASTITLAAKHIIQPGAEQLPRYLPLLKNKRVAVFVNHTSYIGRTHLITTLLKQHIHISKIFTPEHGIYGNDEGTILNSTDPKTGLPIISLYGKKFKPSAEDLYDIDIIVFDIQDVGVRFYTYISSLQKLMEAAAENNKPLIILDRPNPNGFYIDGPVLEPQYRSFTGMQPIPVVYGMTLGEYARMLVGEQWLKIKPKSLPLQLTVIPCAHYTHKSRYIPPIKPSPNLPSIQSIYWYPSIGLMEATALSVGRGTATPFQVFGHPRLRTAFTFTPQATVASKSPLFKNKLCHGWNLAGTPEKTLKQINGQLRIQYLIRAYQLFPDKKHFFAGFSASAGNTSLEKQIKAGMSEQQIRQTWQPQLNKFKKIRKKYLLYPDFNTVAPLRESPHPQNYNAAIPHLGHACAHSHDSHYHPRHH